MEKAARVFREKTLKEGAAIDALRYRRAACSMGYGRGCYAAATLLTAKVFGLTDEREAFRLLNRGCELDHLNSCRQVAKFYERGRPGAGVEKDLKKAMELLKSYCDRGHGESCFDLSEIYADGRAGKKDKKMAAKLREEARAKGYDPE